MPPHPAMTLGAQTDPETHSRNGIGLPRASIETPIVNNALQRLRRRGMRIHVSHRMSSQYRGHLGHDIDIPTVHITLQPPRGLPHHLMLPHFRTGLGEGALHAPPPNVWERTNGPDRGWRRLLAEAPGTDWNPAQHWTDVRLTITDPGSWLEALVRVLDEAAAPKDAQPDLFS